jgi:hypothetical protein
MIVIPKTPPYRIRGHIDSTRRLEDQSPASA